jgi:hypothetical protein
MGPTAPIYGDVAMKRTCAYCQKDFTDKELARAESEGMEDERKALETVAKLTTHPLPCGSGAAGPARRRASPALPTPGPPWATDLTLYPLAQVWRYHRVVA